MSGAQNNKSRPRIKRPRLARSEPRRSWSTLFGAAIGDPAGAPGAPGVNGGKRAPADPINPIRRGVDLGYGVIEEYLRAGQSFAQGFPGLGGPNAPATPALPQLTERMLKYASDFASVWFEAMGTVMAQAQSQAPAPGPVAPAGFPPTAPNGHKHQPNGHAAPVAWTALELAIDARRPTSATIDLHPNAQPGQLELGPLRDDKGKGRLGGASLVFDEAKGRLRLRVKVPAEAAAGSLFRAAIAAPLPPPRGRGDR